MSLYLGSETRSTIHWQLAESEAAFIQVQGTEMLEDLDLYLQDASGIFTRRRKYGSVLMSDKSSWMQSRTVPR